MLTIGSFVWGTRDIPRAIDFWSAALDYEPREEPDLDWAVLVSRTGEGAQLALKLVDSDNARRHHLDLYADDVPAEVDRLIQLGATPLLDWEYEHDADYIVLEDPDGNRFCVAQAPVS
jgi:catechol 2,3-dioxygenase-like lactoylglutathione lyase family enzyme